jgi:hypothetical protein
MLLNATRILRRAKIILAARYLLSNWGLGFIGLDVV